MHNARMVQLIIQGSIQSFKVLWDKSDKTSESEVWHFLDLFHPLAFDTSDEADDHANGYREPCTGKCHHFMAPELPDQFSAIVSQVMVKEANHWCEQSVLQMVVTTNAQKSQTGEAGKFENFVQEIFDVDFRLRSPSFYDNHIDCCGVCSLCDPGIIFVQLRTVTGPMCVCHAPPLRAHLQKEHYYVIQPHS